MFKNKKLIIFDMDGTLIDSVPSLAYAINYMLKELNMHTYKEETIREWVGNGAEILVKRAIAGKKEYKESEIDNNLYTKAKDVFLKFYGENLNSKTTLYPDVISTLSELENRGYTLALATNKPIEFVGDMLKHFNLESFFKIYLGGGSVEFKKPHPLILETICSKLNISNKDSVMVGDSKSDIVAAKEANIDSIALTYGYNQGVNLKDLNPTSIVDNFKDILNLF